jgi:hypothetical protein
MSSMNLASSVAELPSINMGLSTSKYVQVAPSRDCTSSNFPNGAQFFNFSVSSNTWFCPQKSFLRLRVKYTAADGTTQLSTVDSISPNPMMCANLYQSCEFRIGSQTVSRIGQNLAQVQAFKYRMSKSKGWLDTLGEQSDFTSADTPIRQSEITSDFLEIDVGAPADNDGLRIQDVGRQAKEIDCIWQPPLSIFEHKGCLPAGSYQLVLNPENVSQYQLQSILSGVEKTSVDFKFEVTDIYFYVHTIEGETVTNKTYALDLENCECQVQKVEGAGLTQRYFNVSPSTTKLAVAYQDQRVNSDTRCSASYFTSSPTVPIAYGLGSVQNNLSRFFLSYANMQKPQPDANPEYSIADDVDRLGERYNETMLESGMWFNPAGAESYSDWKKRGLLMMFNFPKSGDDSSTRVQVNQQFSNLIAGDITNLNVLLFSISRTSAQITVSNGAVESVELMER